MRHDLRPYWVKKSYLNFRHWYAEYFLRPECVSLGPHHTIMKPWYVHISGANITIGRCFTAIAEPGQRVEIGVWGRNDGEGRVRIGDCVLMSPGSRISAGDDVSIGNGVMMANGSYVTDSDWHTIYDRTVRDERVMPVVHRRQCLAGRPRHGAQGRHHRREQCRRRPGGGNQGCSRQRGGGGQSGPGGQAA